MALLDVANEIKLDHDNVRDLFSRFQAATVADEKAAIANTLIREMAIHSDAEEISVYNDMAKLGLGDTAAHNKDEHAVVKKLVHDADTTSFKNDNYDEVLAKAFHAFDEHAREEEQDQLPLLASKITPEQNDQYARAFLAARKSVPSRPHPSAPQTGGAVQKIAGMQASLHDKIVEKITGRDFVELKLQHPTV